MALAMNVFVMVWIRHWSAFYGGCYWGWLSTKQPRSSTLPLL